MIELPTLVDGVPWILRVLATAGAVTDAKDESQEKFQDPGEIVRKPVPFSRVWGYQRGEYHILGIGFFFAIINSALMPVPPACAAWLRGCWLPSSHGLLAVICYHLRVHDGHLLHD